jgi:hypothetical protein
MRLIGAGLPRTATLSQKVALEMLGLGPCYHMVDVLSDLQRVQQWSNALAGDANWDEIFAGYQSTVDWPGSFYYRELLEAYPDAKVLLSVRDGDDWARSMADTICGLLYNDSMLHDLSSARTRIDPRWQSYLDLMKAMWLRSGLLAYPADSDVIALADAMERHNEEIKRSTDRVLVWTARDGWEPLCEFLEVPVPEAPFPRVNDSGMFVDKFVDSSLDALTGWREQQARSAPQ